MLRTRLHRFVLQLLCRVLGHTFSILWVDVETGCTSDIGECQRCGKQSVERQRQPGRWPRGVDVNEPNSTTEASDAENPESELALIHRFVRQLASALDSKARTEFGEIEQMILRSSMDLCGMTEYPPVSDDEHGERVDGSMICDRCDQEYAVHPMDWRVIGYGDVPFLNVLCDGRRVKL